MKNSRVCLSNSRRSLRTFRAKKFLKFFHFDRFCEKVFSKFLELPINLFFFRQATALAAFCFHASLCLVHLRHLTVYANKKSCKTSRVDFVRVVIFLACTFNVVFVSNFLFLARERKVFKLFFFPFFRSRFLARNLFLEF